MWAHADGRGSEGDEPRQCSRKAQAGGAAKGTGGI